MGAIFYFPKDTYGFPRRGFNSAEGFKFFVFYFFYFSIFSGCMDSHFSFIFLGSIFSRWRRDHGDEELRRLFRRDW